MVDGFTPRGAKAPPVIDWIDTEEPLLRGAIVELQRMARRARTRWPLIVVIAAAITAAFVWKASKKRATYEASITLALTEGSMARRETFLPVLDLRNYVINVLMSGPKLMEVIEARNWYPSRTKLGTEYALSELMDQTDVQVSRNFFLYEDETDAPRSARIDITVVDIDPNQAYAVADAVANVIVASTEEKRQASAAAIASEVRAVQTSLNDKISDLQRRDVELAAAIANAEVAKDLDVLAHLRVEKLTTSDDLKRLGEQLTASGLQGTIEALSEEISAAGQEVEVTRVREDRPMPNPSRGFVLAAMASVVFFMMFIVAAVFLGAFDTRIHDADDLRRLGLPIVGHFPSFPGDHVGALKSRGAPTTSSRGRVPLWRLWR